MGLKKSDHLTEEEVKKILRVAYNELKQAAEEGNTSSFKIAYRNFALIATLAYTGRRINEVLSIRTKDVKFEEEMIYTIVEKRVKPNPKPKPELVNQVKQELREKGVDLPEDLLTEFATKIAIKRLKEKLWRKRNGPKIQELRPIPMLPELSKILRKYIMALGLSPDQRLFGITDRQAERIVKQMAEKAGITYKNVTPHSFRHALITTLRKRGWTYEDIMKITGHKSITSLQSTYDHTEVYDVAEKFKKDLSEVFSPR